MLLYDPAISPLGIEVKWNLMSTRKLVHKCSYQHYPCNRILFTNKKEWGTDTCYNIDKHWKHYAKWKKRVPKHNILYHYIYMK